MVKTRSGKAYGPRKSPYKLPVASMLRIAQKYLNNRSSTGTTMENKQSSGEGLTSSSLSHSSCKIVRSSYIPRQVQNAAAFYSEAFSQIQDSFPGSANCRTLTIEGSTSQVLINTPTSTALGSNTDLTCACYKDLLADVPIAGSAIYPFQGSPPQNITFLKTVGIEVHMTNFSNNDAVVELWVLEGLHDTSVNPDVYATALYTRAAGGLAPNTQPASVGTGVGGTIGSLNDDNPIGDPTKQRGFKKEYKVHKHMRFDLTAGSTHEQEFYVRMNLKRDMADIISKNVRMTNDSATWIDANIDIKYPKGTLFIMSKQRGSPVLDKGGGDARCTYGASQLGFIVKKNKALSWWLTATTKPVYSTAYQQLKFGGTAGAQFFKDVIDETANYVTV